MRPSSVALSIAPGAIGHVDELPVGYQRLTFLLGDSVGMLFQFSNYYGWVAKNWWKRFRLAIQKSQEWASSPFSDSSKIGHFDGPKTAGQFSNDGQCRRGGSRTSCTQIERSHHSYVPRNIDEGQECQHFDLWPAILYRLIPPLYFKLFTLVR